MNCLEYSVKMTMTPMETVPMPFSAKNPPTAAITVKLKLFSKFISFGISPEYDCDRNPAFFKFSLRMIKSRITLSSCEKAFTIRWPEIVSSINPFSSPRFFCCALNSFPVLFVIHLRPKNMRGTMNKVRIVNKGLKYSMTPIVPTSVSTLEKIWMTELFKVELTFSISFVTLLINSPC